MRPKLANVPAATLLSMSTSMWCHVITTFHVTAMSTAMSSATSNYMSSLPSMIAIHVIAMSKATSSSMSLMCDMAIESVTKIILVVTFIFVIENRFGLGFGGPETFYDGFKTSWIKQSVTKF